MSRTEFSKPVKRDALKRSGGLCEATGARYGLRPGQRCNAPLSFGLDYDHGNPDGNGGDASLENCVCCCLRCHDWKTRNVDVPQIAKMKRQRDKHEGIRKASTMPGSRNSKWKKKVGGGVVPRFC